MKLLIERVDSDRKEVLKNLLTLFLHDLSEFNPLIDLNPENGLFEFDVLDWFFEKVGLTPFFLLFDKKLIGFILLQSGPFTNPERAEYIINSFFIINKYRRKGFGRLACDMLFEMFPGRYAVGQMVTNIKAIKFWKNIYESKGIDVIEKEDIEDGIKVIYQYFEVS
ncbi:GNAT family N-acetyltransferase [Neobacillus bataviensis]|uniref:GNAT family N-acetyltransferase n=1 Tax=Neobacillus bataviensis TaxID=220685 RepID=UPI001CBC03FE|nr:GNAT family N-acetyltransferase [Neobacillus bataviensis]